MWKSDRLVFRPPTGHPVPFLPSPSSKSLSARCWPVRYPFLAVPPPSLLRSCLAIPPGWLLATATGCALSRGLRSAIATTSVAESRPEPLPPSLLHTPSPAVLLLGLRLPPWSSVSVAPSSTRATEPHQLPLAVNDAIASARTPVDAIVSPLVFRPGCHHGPSVRSLAAGHQSHAPGSSGGCVTNVLRLSLFAPQRSRLYISYCPAPGFECPPPREVIEHAAPMDGLNHRTHLAPHSRLFITHSAIDTPIANCNSDIPAVLSLSLSPAICFARAPARLPSPRGRKRPLRPFRITAVTQSQTSAERRFSRRGPPAPPPSPSRAPIRTVHLERN